MTNETFPTPEEFCLTVPLYKEYQVNEDNISSVRLLLKYDGHLDTYCSQCQSQTVFNCKNDTRESWIDSGNWYYQPYLTITANCSRDKNHLSIYLFRLNKTSGIQKIGQYPSTADSNLYDAKNIRRF